MPCPPPTHIVSSPIVRSIVSRSFSSVFMIRAPVMPYGWPSAIAPPCGFSLSLERVDAELAADRQHLGGERLVQLHHVDVVDRHPGLGQHLAHRLDRTDAHDLRLDARDARGEDPRARLDPELGRAAAPT